MSTNLAVRLLAEPLRSLAFGSISSTYAGIGTALLNPCRLIKFDNTTNVLITISFDGVNDHFVLPPNGFLLLDVMTNKSDSGGSLTISQGQRFYAMGTGATSGSVYLSVFYGANG